MIHIPRQPEYSTFCNYLYLVKNGHGELLMGQTVWGGAGVLMVGIGHMKMDPPQNIFLKYWIQILTLFVKLHFV